MNSKFNKKIVKKEFTTSEQLVVSTGNLLNQLNVPEDLKNSKQKILERKKIVENSK